MRDALEVRKRAKSGPVSCKRLLTTCATSARADAGTQGRSAPLDGSRAAFYLIRAVRSPGSGYYSWSRAGCLWGRWCWRGERPRRPRCLPRGGAIARRLSSTALTESCHVDQGGPSLSGPSVDLPVAAQHRGATPRMATARLGAFASAAGATKDVASQGHGPFPFRQEHRSIMAP